MAKNLMKLIMIILFLQPVGKCMVQNESLFDIPKLNSLFFFFWVYIFIYHTCHIYIYSNRFLKENNLYQAGPLCVYTCIS